MTQTFASPQVVCRPALPRDHADITEFCKGIWDGGDYVPDVWTDWFHDPNGMLVTAEYNGHAIGCAKLSRIDDGQWWLEGVRVDPKMQGRKVGTQIHNYLIAWWLEHYDGTLRLMTDGQNFVMHHVCHKTGFSKTLEVCAYRATPIAESTENFSRVTDIQEAAVFASQSESVQITNGLVDFGWRIGTPTVQAFENFSNGTAGYVHTFYWWKDKQGMFSAWEDEDDDQRTLVLGVVACSLHDMPAILMDIRRLAAQENFDFVFQLAFDLPQLISQLEAAGFEKRWKRSNAFVFEKQHPAQ